MERAHACFHIAVLTDILVALKQSYGYKQEQQIFKLRKHSEWCHSESFQSEIYMNLFYFIHPFLSTHTHYEAEVKIMW